MNDKERLEEIKTWLNRGFDLTEEDIEWLIGEAEKAERHKKATKECIERMKEGGPGTRSFVYEILKKALEGESDE